MEQSDFNKETVSTHKTKIEQQQVVSFLETIYPEGISNIKSISGGEGSQAFSFENNNEELIIRVNKNLRGFEKDKYAFLEFKSPNLLIPEILKIGEINSTYYYAISKKIEGDTVNKLSGFDTAQITPKLFKVLENIHSIDIKNKPGYGFLNTEGVGENSSWKEFILDVNKFVLATEDKPSMFETSFLEKEVWDTVYIKMVELLEYCQEEKSLVHGDYGSDNVLIKDGDITGVIDWEQSKYGDSLFDIAWLNFWSKGMYKNLYKEYSETLGKKIDNFEERILCYELFIGLSSLSFFAYSNQKEKYENSKQKLLELIKN